MAFSDAEDDQPTRRNNNQSSSNASQSRPSTASTNGAQASSNESELESELNPPPQANGPSEISLSSSSAQAAPEDGSSDIIQSEKSSSPQNAADNSETSAQQLAQNGEAESLPTPPVENGDSRVPTEESQPSADPIKGLSAEKIADKLQKVQDYIQQSSTAMHALENEGDMSKISHYNTLAKVLRDLRASESTLEAHLTKAKEKESNAAAKGSGSEAIGIVGNLTEGRPSSSMDERLTRNQTEAGELTARLRDSVARREELMARYRATRERLNNLKDQRRGIVAEERRVLQEQGAPATPYEDPIPGAETWNAVLLRNSIEDFQGLWNKVDRLQRTYTARMAISSSDDPSATADMEGKLQQLLAKKKQLDDILQQLNRHLQNRENEIDRPEDQPPIAPPSMITEECQEVPTEPAEEPHSEEVAEVAFPTARTVQAAASEVNEISGELLSRKHELNELQEQLSSMKQLLIQTQTINHTNRTQALDRLQSHSEVRAEMPSQDTNHDQLSNSPPEGAVGGIPSSTFVGLNGTVVHLSETERNDPAIIGKFQQLSAAKRRLAKMEDIMVCISEAQKTGRPLQEVLSPECLEILNEANEEYGDHNGSKTTNSNSTRANDRVIPGERISMSQSITQEDVSHRSSIQREPSVNDTYRRQDQDANQLPLHLSKTPSAPWCNSDARNQKEKSPAHKNTRNLWQGGDSSNKGSDPRLNELLILHEELKEKKNALEALTKRMGKSSSYAIDNLSDNLSDNILENNSDTLEKHPSHWGASAAPSAPSAQNHSNDNYQSDEEFGEDEFAGAASRNMEQHSQREAFQEGDKVNNPHIRPRDLHRNPNNNQGRVSVNNLNSSYPRSVRPKYNRSRGSIPKTTYNGAEQGGSIPNPINRRDNKENASFIAQNTVSYALAQLSLVQESINSLYKNLQQSSQATVSALPQQSSTANFPNYYSPFSSYVLPPFNPMMTFPSAFGPGTTTLSDQARNEHQLMAGLQHCFSQLHLHSLEIQSLSKQLQLLEQKEERNQSPQMQNNQENWNLQPSGVSKRNTQEKSLPLHVQSSPIRSVHSRGNLNPSRHVTAMQHHNLNLRSPHVRHHNPTRRISYDKISSITRHHHPFQMNKASCSRITEPSPMGGTHASSNDDVDLSFGNQNFFPPFEGASVDETIERHGGFRAPPRYPVLEEPAEEEEIAENAMWGDIPSQQLTFDASSDILNNQVPPGSRANNYWDNFRSYSHQNSLSTTSKQNTREQSLMHAATSSSDRGQNLINPKVPMQLTASALNTNREFNSTYNPPNNFINKASEKNSASSRSLNQGARPRYPLHASQQQVPSSDSSASMPHNLVQPESTHPTEPTKKKSFKRNNRQTEGSASFQRVHSHREESIGATALNNRNESHIFEEGKRTGLPNRHRDIAELYSLSSFEDDLFAPQISQIVSLPKLSQKSDTQSQVRKEAEFLMKKYSTQPEFLLRLFKNISGISTNADQQVALDLLHELSTHRNSLSDFQPNSSLQISENSLENTEATLHLLPFLELNSSNHSNMQDKHLSFMAGALGGSEASESGVTSEEDENKSFSHTFKNITPSTHGQFSAQALNCQRESSNFISSGYDSCPGEASGMSRPQEAQSLPGISRLSQDPFTTLSSLVESDKALHVSESVSLNTSSLLDGQSRFPAPHTLTHNLFNNSNLQQDCTCFSLSKNRPSVGGKPQAKRMAKEPNFCSGESHQPKKDPFKNLKNHLPDIDFHDDFSSIGCEELATACLQEVLRSFEWLRNNPVTPTEYLVSLHPAIMRRVERCSRLMGGSSDFVLSFESHLKDVLQSFSNKQLPDIIQELATAITQAVISQYYSNLFPNGDSRNHVSNDCAKNDHFSSNSSTNNYLFSPQERLLNQVIDDSGSHPTPPSNIFSLSASRSHPVSHEATKSIHKNSFSTSTSFKPPKSISTLSFPKRSDSLRSSKQTSNLSKALGAILKSSSRSVSNESELPPPILHNEVSETKESPLSESSFPESWGAVAPLLNRPHDIENTQTESNQRLATKRTNITDPDYFVRTFCAANLKDAEADQQESQCHNVGLPVHDLAEADQSRDALELGSSESITQLDSLALCNGYSYVDNPLMSPDEGACGGTSSFSSPHIISKSSSPKQNDSYLEQEITTQRTLCPSSNMVNSEQGLDEVPTKLLSPGLCSPFMFSNEENTTASSLHRQEYVHSSECASNAAADQEETGPQERSIQFIPGSGSNSTGSCGMHSQEVQHANIGDKSG